MADDVSTPPVVFADDGRLSPLSTPSATREVLEAHGIGTKYTLGQNFLVNDDVLKKIIVLADVQPTDCVLEVGPGIGTLTIALLKHAAAVVSIERDPDLPAVLADTLWPWRDSFALIEKDALDVTESDIVSAMAKFRVGAGLTGKASSAAAETAQRAVSPSEDGPSDSVYLASSTGKSGLGDSAYLASPTGKSGLDAAGPESLTGEGSSSQTEGDILPNKLVANLPYAVAATVVLDYFQQFPSLQSATVMVQKEVADRMAAVVGTKNYGAYTVKLGLYARPAGRFAVGPGNFFPPPRVDSAVIRLDRTAPLDAAGAPASPELIEAACIMADAAFANRRKTLANSCKTYFSGRGALKLPGGSVEASSLVTQLPSLFERAAVDPKRRGETLDQQEFLALGAALLACAARR